MLSRNNWISFDWDGVIPRNKSENVRVNFAEQTESIIDFDTICDITANEIAKQYDNLYIAMSGGADSECVAQVFYRNNIPFKPIILTWAGHVNPENVYAFDWCEKRNIEPVIIEKTFDVFKSDGEYANLMKTVKPRLLYGVTTQIVTGEVEKLGGNLVTGMQMEYHPDEQFVGTEGIDKNYQGFLINESDPYFEIISPNRHPWAFFYWSPDIMASTAYHWDTSLDLTNAKAKLYNTVIRPKNPNKVFLENVPRIFKRARNYFGTIDCALLGNKQELLAKLLKRPRLHPAI